MNFEKKPKYTCVPQNLLMIETNRESKNVTCMLHHYLQITSLSQRTDPVVLKWYDAFTNEIYSSQNFLFERLNTLLRVNFLFFHNKQYKECCFILSEILKELNQLEKKQKDLDMEFIKGMLYYCHVKLNFKVLNIYSIKYYIEESFNLITSFYKRNQNLFSDTALDSIKYFLKDVKIEYDKIKLMFCIHYTQKLKSENKLFSAYQMINSCKNINTDALNKNLINTLISDLKIQSQFDNDREIVEIKEEIIGIDYKGEFTKLLKDVNFVDEAKNMFKKSFIEKINKFNEELIIESKLINIDNLGIRYLKIFNFYLKIKQLQNDQQKSFNNAKENKTAEKLIDDLRCLTNKCTETSKKVFFLYQNSEKTYSNLNMESNMINDLFYDFELHFEIFSDQKEIIIELIKRYKPEKIFLEINQDFINIFNDLLVKIIELKKRKENIDNFLSKKKLLKINLNDIPIEFVYDNTSIEISNIYNNIKKNIGYQMIEIEKFKEDLEFIEKEKILVYKNYNFENLIRNYVNKKKLIKKLKLYHKIIEKIDYFLENEYQKIKKILIVWWMLITNQIKKLLILLKFDF